MSVIFARPLVASNGGSSLSGIGLCALLTLCGCADEQPIVGTWAQTGSESRVGDDEWAELDDAACRLDNTEEYGEDGSWVLYDGTDQCGAGTGIVRGTWQLAASDTKIVYTYEGAAGEYESTVESLTSTELVLTNSTGDTAGTQVRSTYEKQ
ncbi:MAG: lipocalin family protein [Myxococcota bacterium]